MDESSDAGLSPIRARSVFPFLFSLGEASSKITPLLFPFSDGTSRIRFTTQICYAIIDFTPMILVFPQMFREWSLVPLVFPPPCFIEVMFRLDLRPLIQKEKKGFSTPSLLFQAFLCRLPPQVPPYSTSPSWRGVRVGSTFASFSAGVLVEKQCDGAGFPFQRCVEPSPLPVS